jgi:hypothetical protein
LLPNGKVIIAGGYDLVALKSAELYDPASGTWRATGRLVTARRFHVATLLPDGKVLVAGGADTVGFSLASAELYDPASEIWTATGSLATARPGHTGTLLLNGKVLVAGGDTSDNVVLASAELYISDETSGLTLGAVRRKVEGINTVHLTWSGATSGQIDVYRCVRKDGPGYNCAPIPIVTTANDGSYTDSTGDTGRASYKYRVCEAGTSTCSNTAEVPK